MLNPRLADVAAAILRVPAGRLVPASAAGSVAAWDSLGHLQLIMEVERVFGVHFQSDEIPELTTLARIQAELERRGRIAAE